VNYLRVSCLLALAYGGRAEGPTSRGARWVIVGPIGLVAVVLEVLGLTSFKPDRKVRGRLNASRHGFEP
jgi:hypothetical protein